MDHKLKAEEYYGDVFLGYTDGMKASTAGYLSNYVQSKETQLVTEPPTLLVDHHKTLRESQADALKIVTAMQEKCLKGQYMRKLVTTKVDVPRTKLKRMVKTPRGHWVSSDGAPPPAKCVRVVTDAPKKPPSKSLKLPAIKNTLPKQDSPEYIQRPYDVFLTTKRPPLLGVAVKERTLGGSKRLDPLCFASTEAVKKELSDFEDRHKGILSKGTNLDGNIKAANMLKSNRSRQLRDLKASELPRLLKIMPPNKLQELYVAVTGSLQAEMTSHSFTAFVTHLIRPDPPLPIEDTTWMFEAVDKDGSGSVSFVELVEVLSAVVTPLPVQDTIKKLFSVLQEEDKVRRDSLEPSNVLSRVKRAFSELLVKRRNERQMAGVRALAEQANPDPAIPKGIMAQPTIIDMRVDEAEMLKKLSLWKSIADQLWHASIDLKSSDALGRDEFVVLLFMNTQIMDSLQSALIE